MLRPGEVTQTHRHNYSAVYHAFRRHWGDADVNGREIRLGTRRLFCSAAWGSAQPSESLVKNNEAILLSVSDRPVMEALQLYREEAGEGA